METVSLVLTSAFTGVSAIAAVVMCWIACVDRRKRLRDERPNLVAFVRFHPEKSHRSGKTVVRFDLCVRNSGHVPFHVVEWLPLDPSDKLDVASSLRHQTIDPGAVVSGRAVLEAREDPEPFKLLLVTGDCRMMEIEVQDLTYYRTAEEMRNHRPVSAPILV